MTRNRTAYIHIGLHKTGSTAIQIAFDKFSNEKLVVPSFGSDANQSIPLMNSFMIKPENYPINKIHGRSNKQVNALKQNARAILTDVLVNDDRDIFLSGEDLRYLPLQDLKEMKSFFAGHVDNIRIIVFVRDPIGYCCSAFSEGLKHGKLEFDFPMPNFEKGFQKYIDVFGKEAIIMERHRPKEASSIEIMANILGVDEPKSMRANANTSFSLEAGRILHSICTLVEDHKPSERHHLARKLRPHVAGIGNEKVVASRALVEPLINHTDLAWLEREFSVKFDLEKALSKLDQNCTIRSVDDLKMTQEDRVQIQGRLGLKSTSDDAFKAFARKVIRKEISWKRYAQPIEKKLKRHLLGR